MSLAHPDAERVAQLYLDRRGATILARCGYGKEGVVFKSSHGTAVKVHSAEQTFWNEYYAYQRLTETETVRVRGFRVPKLINTDKKLRVIEMGIVEPPCLLDFGTSSTDHEPDFEQEAWDTWWEKLQEDFGDRFPEAEAVFYFLRNYLNVWHLDLSTNNLQFASG